MNILFISRLSNNNNCGPYYSIPRQVAAQRIYDNVFWLNANNNYFEEWEKIGEVKTEKDYPNPRLRNLPEPFNHPDIVVLEEQYNFIRMPLMLDVKKNNIPYIIVPRCSLTGSALKKKVFKKKIANVVYFKRFIRNAAGIQYLTEREKSESGVGWNKNNFVIPNGIKIPCIDKNYNKNHIEVSFIGRIDIYHKGLDIIVSACKRLKKEMEYVNMHISIYGAGQKQDEEFLVNAIDSLKGVVDYRGPVHGKEKEKVLIESDAFILTSRFEGMPMGILEALSYGVPVIITQGTNMSAVVNEYDCGWVADSTEESVVSLLRSFIKDKDSIPQKGQNGKIAASKFDWDSIAKKTHQVLLTIVKNFNQNEGRYE